MTELTDAFDHSTSSIHNYLNTLEQDGYVVKEDTHYRIRLRLLNLGGHARHRERIYDIAKDDVTALAEEIEELANLLMEEHGRGISASRTRRRRRQDRTSANGSTYTALGHAILTHLPHDRVTDIRLIRLSATTENTITDRNELLTRPD